MSPNTMKRVNVKVGWAAPSDRIKFNFHVTFDQLRWTEVIDYANLELLNNWLSVNSSISEPFVKLGPEELGYIIETLESKEFDPSSIKKLERYRKCMEIWINEVLANLNSIDDESRQLCKQLFFCSPLKMEKFDLLVKYEPVFHSHEVHHERKSFYQSAVGTVGMLGLLGIDSAALNQSNLQRFGNENTKVSPTTKSTTSHQPANRLSLLFGKNKNHARSQADGGSEMNEDFLQQKIERGKTSILKINVARGEEIRSGVLVYDITLTIVNKATNRILLYSTFQRYRSFKLLHDKLNEVDMKISTAGHTGSVEEEASLHRHFMERILSPFPDIPMKSYIGLGLSDSDLADRTRHLDNWFREICINYRHMPAEAKTLLRTFLNFNMSRAKDIEMQDHLTWGSIEAGAGLQEEPVVYVQKSALEAMPDGFISEEVRSQLDGSNQSHHPTAAAAAAVTGRPSMKPRHSLHLQHIILETASMQDDSHHQHSNSIGYSTGELVK